MRTFAQRLMNSGSSRERMLGRALARGRSRTSPELAQILKMAEDVIKDMGGATTGADVYTPTAGGNERDTAAAPKHNERQTRLRVPWRT